MMAGIFYANNWGRSKFPGLSVYNHGQKLTNCLLMILKSSQFSLTITSQKQSRKSKIQNYTQTRFPCNCHRLSMAANNSSDDSRHQLTVASLHQISKDVQGSYNTIPEKQNGSPEIQEPSLKIPKLYRNGVHEASQNIISVLRVKKLSEKAVLPSRGSLLAAGYDLSSATEIKVPARGKALVPTDLSIAIPEGTYARIAPRSGLAWKYSIDVGAGVIDADYRGPVGVILFNHSDVDFEVKVGDRIAQLIIEKIMTPNVLEVEDLGSTVRGEGGFGSTVF